MAPIPTNFDADAVVLLQSIERRQNDLSTFQIPRLRTCTGPLVTQQAWAAEVRDDIERLARQIEELDVLVDDQPNERARAALRAKVDEYSKILEGLRKDSRAAILSSKRAIDIQSRSQREELLRSPSVRPQESSSSNEKTTEDALMKANNNVTETLQRTINLMQKELEKSVLSSQLLETSTANLQSASQTHDTLTLLLGTSKQLVTALEKTDWLDRVLIISALVFFALVVLFILKQRVLDRGLRIAFWWTRFVPGMSPDRRTAVETVKEVAVDVAAATSSLASGVLTATAASSTLGSMFVATASVPRVAVDLPAIDSSAPGATNDVSATTTVLLDPTIVPEPDAAHISIDPLHTPLTDPPHIEL